MGTSLYEQYQAEAGGPKGPKAPASLYEQYQQSNPGAVARESLRLDIPSESTRALPFNRPNPRGDLESLEGAPRALVKPLAASALVAAQGIPGMEAFESAAGSLGSKFTDNPMTFRESRDALRSQTDHIPKPIKLALQAPGLLKAAAGLALSPAKAGALFGAGDQALSADDMSLAERGARTAIGGVGGAVAGKILDAGITGVRAIMSKSPGANALARKEAQAVASKANYGAAAAEGAAATNVTPITTVLQHPDIKPFAKMVRGARQFAGADEPTVLRETFKLMSKQQGGLAQSLKKDGFDAARQLKHDNIKLAKDELLNAADQLGPAFRKAVQVHAATAREIEAVGTGAEAGRRAVSAPATGKRVATQSREAYEATIRKMAPNEQAPAIEGVLGDLKGRIGVTPNAISGFGALTSALRPMDVGNLLRKVGDPRQQMLDKIVRGGFLGASSLIP